MEGTTAVALVMEGAKLDTPQLDFVPFPVSVVTEEEGDRFPSLEGEAKTEADIFFVSEELHDVVGDTVAVAMDGGDEEEGEDEVEEDELDKLGEVDGLLWMEEELFDVGILDGVN